MDVDEITTGVDNKLNVSTPEVEEKALPKITKLLDLNDDCLKVIISLILLKDLCELADTCRRLRKLICPKELEMKIGYNENDYKFTRETNQSEFLKSAKDVKPILAKWGKQLHLLEIHRNDPFVTDLIAKYCSGGTLQTLELFTLECAKDLEVKFAPIYKQLMVLSIRDCHVYQNVQKFNCDELLELKIIHVNGYGAILENNDFPNLERFTFVDKRYNEAIPTNRWTTRATQLNTIVSFIERHEDIYTVTDKL